MGKRVKCIYCGCDVHVNDLGAIVKGGIICSDMSCLEKLKIGKTDEQTNQKENS